MPVSPQENYPLEGDDSESRLGQPKDGGAGGGAEAQDQELDADPGEEEVQESSTIKVPDAPTKEELAEHQANGHLPYRSWCPECVEAFGR